MSLPLKDFRLGITESIDLWLEVEGGAFSKDKATVAREILAEWAKRKAHAFRLAHRRLASNGLQADWLGEDADDDARGAGVVPADAGVSRKRSSG